MKKTIAILATMDTKGAECEFLKEEISKLGAESFLIDMGVVGEPALSVDVTNEQLAIRGGKTLTELRDHPSRQEASQVMVDGSISLLLELITEQKVHAVISMGGTQGTNNGCKVMQALPYCFPKIMVSTMASGDTSAFVGIKDITMMFSVSDILGLNPFFRRILANAAGAAYGMAQVPHDVHFNSTRPVIGISNLGVLTQGTMKAIELFKARGYESIVFHAIGSGSRAMEQLMTDGIIKAVFDFGLGDIADALYDGVRAADENRLTVAGKLGLPQVIVPGGIDHVGILLDEENTVPDMYKNHIYSYHNPVIFVPRTNAQEMTNIMEEIANRLQHTKDNAVFLLPKKGVSSYSAKGGDLYDPATDEIFHGVVRELVPKQIKLVEMDNNAEDEAFVRCAVDTLIDLIEQSN
jgi:uncharacterized protein (UPF0261 family)